MIATIDTVFQEALQLNEDSRLDLVERLIVSSSSYAAVEQEQIKVAESRLQEMRSGAVKGVPVEDALQRIRESLKNSASA
jgi:hypothetical protein